jgi:hypothetical protein
MKKHVIKAFVPVSAVAAVFGMAAPAAHAQTTPVFNYNFPASWNGTVTTITDQSVAGNNAGFDGTLALSATVPPAAPGGTESVVTTAGGILTTANSLLTNSAVSTAGGFTMSTAFMWNGTDKTGNGHTQKLIDYAGTESLQLITTATGSAALQMQFGNDLGAETIPVSTTVLSNTWYNVELDFNATSMVGADVAGTANLYVNGALVASGAAVKGTYGDSLARPIGVGQLGARFGYLVGFTGDIYNPSVSLGVVPEPSTLALAGLGGLALRRVRRRKA